VVFVLQVLICHRRLVQPHILLLKRSYKMDNFVVKAITIKSFFSDCALKVFINYNSLRETSFYYRPTVDRFKDVIFD
jgi:hypothetical protein